MDITVAICTWNRAKLLDQTLAQICRLQIPAGVQWELLVVDNNSPDNTQQILSQYADKLPLKVLFEPQQGHCHARNCAIDSAAGKLLIWTDDDVLVDEHWVARYLAAAERWPQASFFGGKVLPWYASPPPRWVRHRWQVLQGMLVMCDRGTEERELEGEEFCVGANMAYRTTVFQDFRFDPKMGLKGGDAVRGDEVAFQQQLRAAGHRGVYVPDVLVQHYLDEKRLSRKFLWDYFVGQGRTEIRRLGVPTGATLAGAPRWLVRRHWAARWHAWLRMMHPQDSWVDRYKEAAMYWGMIDECRKLNQYSQSVKPS